MRPKRGDIAVPPFPPGLHWIGGAPAPVERLAAVGALLVEFVDLGHHSSVRTLPYLRGWHERYAAMGLSVLAVNSPRFPFTADPERLAAAAARLDLPFPVAADAEYAVWRAYGCHGWPSLFLWGPGGALRWFHYGEGEYAGTEEAIRELLLEVDPLRRLPAPMSPFRDSDRPGALLVPPSDEVFPGGALSTPWAGEPSGAALEISYEGAAAYATVDGRGALEVTLDGGAREPIAIEAPGSYELASHEHHGAHRLALRPTDGVLVYAIGFGPGPAGGG
jgi:hypothetical protein